MAFFNNMNHGASETDKNRAQPSSPSSDWLNLIYPIHTTIMGSKAADTLSAQAERDVVDGQDSNDDLGSTFNNTALVGGRGRDTLTTDASVMPRDGGSANGLAIQLGGADNDILNLTVTMHGDIRSWQDPQQVLTADILADGGCGDDQINATAQVEGPTTAHVMLKTNSFGGTGMDTIHATAIATGAIGDNWVGNTVDGGAGNDHITVDAQTELVADSGVAINVVDGGDGNDVIDARAVGRSQYTPLVKNSLHGGRGDDAVHAFSFSDSNSSWAFAVNELWGDEGKDTLEAVHSTDGENGVTDLKSYLDGGAGDDTLRAESLALGGYVRAINHLEGGTGRDTLSASINSQLTSGGGPIAGDHYGLSNILNGGDHDDILEGSLSLDTNGYEKDNSFAENRLDGGTGDDMLKATVASGSSGTSFLSGGSGHDQLTVVGGRGNVLDGGDGKDTLTSGAGDDRMIGGEKADVFLFGPQNGHDTITDLERGKDKIDLTAFAVDKIDSFADLIIQTIGSNSVVRFDGGNDITVEGATNLSAKDFWFA
ncbi:M10 family metallopeptidase C-terminal domain-containing protein [Microvirga sp. 0TCS3.31]